MKKISLLFLLLFTPLLADDKKIGVYDSRSVAIAFAGSTPFEKWMAPLMTEMKKAQAAGDKEKIAKLTAKGKARQNKLHTQAFNGAPVTDILEHVKDKLPAIKKKAGVSALISKWDEKELSRFEKAKQLDVTELLVDAFEPNKKQRKSALEIQKEELLPRKK